MISNNEKKKFVFSSKHIQLELLNLVSETNYILENKK